MANTLLSPTIITREALRYFHQESIFIRSINRQYDNQFANSGASPSGKIGPSLTIRMPNRFTVSTGAALQIQDVVEESQVLTVSTQKHVDFSFPIIDRTLTIDEFGPRYLQPAMARLAADIEADALTMVKDIYNFVDNDSGAVSFLNYLQAAQLLNENLAFDDGKRQVLMSETHNTKLVDAVKGLFNPQSTIGEAYRKGTVARDTAGFNEYSHTTLLTNQATGTCAKVTGYTVNDATGGVSGTITLAAGSNTFKKGDILTFVGCNAVHPETKADLGYLKKFVVTADYSGGAGAVSIAPSTVISGAKQNVTAYPTNGGGGLVVKVGAGASETYVQSLCFHPDAFTFVTADLIDPSQYGAWGARRVMDGVSMRIAQQYDIVNDRVPCRIDVLYGYKTIRPELAARLHADG